LFFISIFFLKSAGLLTLFACLCNKNSERVRRRGKLHNGAKNCIGREQGVRREAENNPGKKNCALGLLARRLHEASGHPHVVDLSLPDTLSTFKKWSRMIAGSNRVQLQPIQISHPGIAGRKNVVIDRRGLDRLQNPRGIPFVNLGVTVGK